mgnify:CR=1 FL=1
MRFHLKMPEIGPLPKDKPIFHLLKWKGLEIAFLFLFIFGMYYQEIELIKYIYL